MKRKFIVSSIIILAVITTCMSLSGFKASADGEVNDDSTLIPQTQMTATASSEHPNIGTEGLASFAIDGNESTIWHTKWSGTPDALPQHITLALGGNYIVNKFTYLPRQGGATNGMITKYELQVSTDGEKFQTVKAGSLRNDSILKVINFNEVEATHIRFVALEGSTGFASAAELNVYKQNEEPEVEVVGNLTIDSESTVKVDENLELSIGLKEVKENLNLFGGSIDIEYDPEIFELNEIKSLREDMMVEGKLIENGKVQILIASLTGDPIPVNEDFINVSLKSRKVSEESTINLTLGEFGDVNGNLYNMSLPSAYIEVLSNKIDGEIIVKPNKITKLNIDNKKADSVNLSWNYEDDGTAPVEFIIYKDGTEIVRTNETNYKVESLKSNRIYGFKVVTMNKDGEESKPVSKNVRTSKK